jgi:hypothetical protein
MGGVCDENSWEKAHFRIARTLRRYRCLVPERVSLGSEMPFSCKFFELIAGAPPKGLRGIGKAGDTRFKRMGSCGGETYNAERLP